MKRRVFAALLFVSFGFIVVADLPPYAAGVIVVGAWALAVLVVLLLRELVEVREEHRHSTVLQHRVDVDEALLDRVLGPRRGPDVDDPTRRTR